MSEFFQKLVKKVDIEEGMQGIRDILLAIYRSGTISVKKISRRTKLPVPIVSKVVNILIEKQMLFRNEFGVQFWEHAMKFIEKEFKFYGYGISPCPTCNGRPRYISPRIESLFDVLNPIFEARPQVDTALDQSKNTVETAIQRALYLYDEGALEGNDVLFIGDDDFTSVAVGNLFHILFPEDPKLVPKSITVIDVDERILERIDAEFGKLKLDVKTVLYNLKDPIPADLRGRFDMVITDPAYSINGLQLFLSRAIEMMKNDFRQRIGLDIFLSYAHRSPDKTVEFQRLLSSMGLAMMEIIPAFNKYEGSEVLGNITQLVHLKTSRHTESPIHPDKSFDDVLYTGETHPYLRQYKCVNCSAVIRVGPDMDFESIELLKGDGCPACGNSKKFELISRNLIGIE